METLKIGIIGFGTVGTGVTRILLHNQKAIQDRLGAALQISKIADIDLNTDRGIVVDPSLLTTEAMDLINDPEIAIIAELIGGEEPAASFFHQAIAAGKHVVTANKALLSKRGAEFFEAAHKQGVEIGFEGSVCGGIPIIQAIRDGLAANRITQIYGILNGTANFILTRMTDEGRDFDDVLAEAQKLGYAEANPSLDIHGHDTAHKLSILLSLIYGRQVDSATIYTEGIAGITPLDIEFARELGYRIRLLAIFKDDNAAIEARVHPTLIPAHSLLSHVTGAYNAVFVTGDAVGSTMFYGQGAGMMPTGSAVVSDLIRIAGNILHGKSNQPSPLYALHAPPVKIKDSGRIRTTYYLRFSATDQTGVLSEISGILADNEISISSVIQRGRQLGGSVPIFMLVHEAYEENILRALNDIDALPVTLEKTMLIRIEDNFDTLMR